MVMYQSVAFPAGGYRYLPAVFQYSAGVAAEPGHALEQVRFVRPLPLARAYRAIEEHLHRLGRPMSALAHCELRSPRQFDDQGFIDFNREYVKTLARWGLYQPESGHAPAVNPVARTNVCPEFDAPTEPAMHAFTYTVASDAGPTSFMLSGGGEARPGPQPYRERIVAYGDTSDAGLRAKLEFVVEEMSARLRGLGCTWEQATGMQAYSVHDLGPLVGQVLAPRGLMPAGLTWHYARPPVAGLEVELDVRGAVRLVFMT